MTKESTKEEQAGRLQVWGIPDEEKRWASVVHHSAQHSSQAHHPANDAALVRALVRTHEAAHDRTWAHEQVYPAVNRNRPLPAANNGSPTDACTFHGSCYTS